MYKKEDLIREKLNLEIEDTKESKVIRFLGGKLSIYVLAILILLFTTIWLYNQISGILEPVSIIFNILVTPVLIAYILFYVLRPVHKILNGKFKVSAGISAILSIIFGLVVITSIFVGVIPVMVEQTQSLIISVPRYVETIRTYAEANSDNAIVHYMVDYINTSLNVSQLSSTAFDIFSKFVSNATGVVSSMATIIVTAPFVLFYLLKDSTKFRKYVIDHLPKYYKEEVDGIISEIDDKVGSYISGQMLVSLCIGVLLFIGYTIIGLDYAMSLATLAAVLSIIPYLGPALAILPAVIVALATSWVMLIKIAVVWAVVQFLEGNFISPNIMGHSLKIHPLTVIFIILIATSTFGIVGAIVGIPAYAIIKILVTKFIIALRGRYSRIFHLEYNDEDLVKENKED
ncbi:MULTISPECIES: AI-2E family transporter [unclassified Gemella]|uniref:AI-2E family transporter n=1 Tax=unclassified Gemella TaxID=2624949 RepID=UPI0010731CEE|nr:MULTISPECIES: AI-2E family transporter [unclassified Gemella]MBF0709875.1 AI-2E family transporter [Gemella sp. GL1.1]MBF0746821.1 AI-2E family transporter [Gemella sp. 19428wG2_WT2a]NYS27219.1 AI-2E family transporter [Gemella sp. GL1]TFU59546.1 AI-2E family transporter [Gemella sp. WT2a]